MGTNILSKSTLRISWVCQIIAAIILGQTLFFKFTGAPHSSLGIGSNFTAAE